jgi:hypothetical protein
MLQLRGIDCLFSDKIANPDLGLGQLIVLVPILGHIPWVILSPRSRLFPAYPFGALFTTEFLSISAWLNRATGASHHVWW